MKSKRIVLVGGGLTGMALAFLLSKENVEIQIVEASTRLGGRIHTSLGKLGTPLELGATWFSEVHQNLLHLMRELGLEKFSQFSMGKSLFQADLNEAAHVFYVPSSEDPSYRIVGGTACLIEKLRENIPNVDILLNTKISSIIDNGDEIILKTREGQSLNADVVIICLPPQLAGLQIQFLPALPSELMHILPTVQTWMSESIKFVLEYDQPFWREHGFSGMIYSHVGIVSEMYDHTNYECTKFGFTGFLNKDAANYAQEERRQMVLQHLNLLLGSSVLRPSTYLDKVWTGEHVFEESPRMLRPHQNNGHYVLQQGYMNGKLYFSGTETATEYAGYMEGAIQSAKRAARSLTDNFMMPTNPKTR